jgi:hypothetical protein
VHERALAAIQECSREVIEGALASLLFTAIAFQTGLGMVRTPWSDVEALTAGTLEGSIFPAQHMGGYSIKKAEYTPYQESGMDGNLWRAVAVPERGG